MSELKSYLFYVKNRGEVRIKVPADWKVTFGAACPGGRYAADPHNGLCLRFYEAKDKQRAVFQNVIWFRDESLEIKELGMVVGKDYDGDEYENVVTSLSSGY